MADHNAVDGERDRSRNHRLTLHDGVAGSVQVNRDTERSERDRGSRSKKAGEALGAKNISQHRERRHHGAADEEADNVFGHLAFFQSFDSGPPLPWTGSLRGGTLGMVASSSEAFRLPGRPRPVACSGYFFAFSRTGMTKPL